MHREVHVRKSRTGAQRSKTAAVEFAEAGVAEAPAPPAPPGMEKITRSQRQPTDRAEAKSKSDSETPAESEE
jgi:hypothetical protein